ncbi:diguanylate cyclase [uncultured Williamsia sp.]|uniref:GGDEF domain-containing protein n=1 Tax=uncultured Williamsia sp. TaxID=259311 RepID=UPI0026088BE0|nr:GGDEF domain-containing protein [uncultured Williamsia sp.]
MDGAERVRRRGAARPPVRADPLVDEPDLIAQVRWWWTHPFDYSFAITHHSTRSLHLPYRLLMAVATTGMGICSMLLLASDRGPSGTLARAWPVVVLVAQAVFVVIVLVAPAPRSARTARIAFVSAAVFCDVGLTSVLLLYSPVVSAVACALFALPSALCAFCLSARWMVAHLVWCTAVIAICGYRTALSGEFDSWAVAAGIVVMLMAVCLMPTATHIAWSLLSADARDSLIDPLTGVLNRRGLWSAIRPLWSSALDSGAVLAVIMVDVDDFKSVNDRHGHDVGDAVLRELAAAVDVAAPSTSAVARTGGEEFTVLAAGTDDEVGAVVQELPAAVGAAVRTVTITVSVGAAIVHPTVGGDLAPIVRRATRAADDLMYEAKRAGGDTARVGDLR